MKENKDKEKTIIKLYNGDNKEILKKYKNKINANIVYLDPPYNTKNKSLTYEDSLENSQWSKDFLELIEEIKNNIQENAIIFVSIGIDELANSLILLKKVFGKKAIIAILPRRTHNGHKTSKTINLQHDFLIFVKIGKVEFVGLEKINEESYRKKDKFFEKRGYYQLRRVDYKNFNWSENSDFEYKHDNEIFFPGEVSKKEWKKRKEKHNVKDWTWIWSKEKIDFAIKNDFIEIKDNKLFKKTYTKSYINKIGSKKYEVVENSQRTKKIDSFFFADKEYAIKKSKTEIESLFDYPKSDILIEHLLKLPNFKEKIILDPFGGTGTTAIMSSKLKVKEVHIIQKNEKTNPKSKAYKNGFKNIYELTKKNIEDRTKINVKEEK